MPFFPNNRVEYEKLVFAFVSTMKLGRTYEESDKESKCPQFKLFTKKRVQRDPVSGVKLNLRVK